MGKISAYFKDWLYSNSIDYYKFASRSVAGEKTFDASANVPCYIDETIKQIINFRNEEVLSDTQVYIDGDFDLVSDMTMDDKFVIRDKDRLPKNIRYFRDENANIDYVMVYL